MGPGTRDPVGGTRDPGPLKWDPVGGTRDPGPLKWDPGPGTRYFKDSPGTRNLEPAALAPEKLIIEKNLKNLKINIKKAINI